MLIDDYFIYQKDYEKKYGLKTLVLMQVGSFFEFYGVDNSEEKIGNMKQITDILNVQLTRRNKAILENSRSNCLMAGVPCPSLKRHLQLLLNHNYTVVLIEQVTEPPNPKREVTNIFSPGTYIEEVNQSDPNYIVSIFITEESCFKSGKSIFILGCSSIELSTGNSIVYEGQSFTYEKLALFEEMYRFIESFNPKEILINTNNLKNISHQEITTKINANNRLFYFYDSVQNQYFTINYQNEFLKKVFQTSGFLSPIENLDFEKKPNALVSYLLLLQFVYEHNERMVEKIQKPTTWEYEKHLILYNNAIYQLNILPTQNYEQVATKYRCLYDVIQKTSTNLGKRLLKYRIMNPIISSKTLNERYDQIEYMLDDSVRIPIEKELNDIVDIERFHRKMVLQLLHPHEFLQLSYSYEYILKIMDVLYISINFSNNGFKTFHSDEKYYNQLKTLVNEYKQIFHLLEMGKYNLLTITNSFFKSGHYEEIDSVQNEIQKCNLYFENQCKYLSKYIEESISSDDLVKVEHNERDGYFLYTTKKRSDILEKKWSAEDKKKYEIKKYTGTNVKIVSKDLHENSDKLIELKDKIQLITKEKYIEVCSDFYTRYQDLFLELSRLIAELDVAKSGAITVKKYRYIRPIIEDKFSQTSYLEVKGIRHPIIEVIQEDHEYIANDVELHHTTTNGILLFGVNGAGKSSFSKAIGCNIVLAQMGMFVSCKEFIFYPYTKIFTRINGDDNIFKGMSSFVVEMNELRSILKYSDNRSIVLGDEVCKGTEETSALSIVSSSIKCFCEKNVNFVFATHFHKLASLECMKSIQNIKLKHLTMEYDNNLRTFVYNRILQDGMGPEHYGIEIANFIIEDDDFIEHAKEVRNEILNRPNKDFLNDKTSNYNSNLYLQGCSICGDNGDKYSLDTHHIVEQNQFEQGDFHKDRLSNLVILCKKHHEEVHHGNLQINGYKDTPQGSYLSFEYLEDQTVKILSKDSPENIIITSNNSESNSDISSITKVSHSKFNKKYTEEQVSLVKNLYKSLQEQKNAMKTLLCELKKNGLTIAQKTVQKMINDEY